MRALRPPLPRWKIAAGMVAAVTLVAAAGLIVSSYAAPPPPPPKPGERPPGFSLKDLDGRTRQLSDLEGKVVSLHFFALWCEPCMKDLQEIEKTAARFRGRGYRALLVAVKHRLQAERLRKFASDRGMELEVLLDESGRVQNAYGVEGLPYGVLIDRGGRVQFSGSRLPPSFGRLVEGLVTRKRR